MRGAACWPVGAPGRRSPCRRWPPRWCSVAAPAMADPVTVTPSAAGMGTLGTKIQNLLNMTGQVALWASLGSVLVGAARVGPVEAFRELRRRPQGHAAGDRRRRRRACWSRRRPPSSTPRSAPDMAGSGDARRRPPGAGVRPRLLALFGLGVGVGTQLVGGRQPGRGSRRRGHRAGQAAAARLVAVGGGRGRGLRHGDGAAVPARSRPAPRRSWPATPPTPTGRPWCNGGHRAGAPAAADGVAGGPSRVPPVGAGRAVVSYSPGQAEVSAWVMVVAGQSGVADNAVCSFSTVDLQLVFERGGVADQRAAPSSPGRRRR